MSRQRIPIELHGDVVKKQSKATPLKAIAELIWNSLDGDATEVRVEFVKENLAQEVNKIIVSDNGRGFSHTDASKYFRKLGGSWKRQTDYTEGYHRKIHGKEGRGRYKALALGEVALWKVCFAPNGREFYTFEIEMSRKDINSFLLTDSKISNDSAGVTVTIEQLHEKTKTLESDATIQNLTEVFAPYVMNYEDVEVRFGEVGLNPRSIVKDDFTHELEPVKDQEGHKHLVNIQIIEWGKKTQSKLYFCSEDGFPRHQINIDLNLSDFFFSVYVKSSYISRLFDAERLTLAEMDNTLNAIIDKTKDFVRSRFRIKASERARSIVDAWKEEDIYPFDDKDQSPIAVAERQVFDIVAVNMKSYSDDFDKAPKKSREIQLRLLKNAIEHSPKDLKRIISEVLQLTKQKQQELAQLLDETSLAAMIEASKTVANRLKFLKGLEIILFEEESKKKIKERTQLHKVLAENTWIFGEKYNLWVSDGDLTRILEKYREFLSPDIVIDKPVTIDGKKRGLIDLMLSKQVKRQNEQVIENLIIELKAPKHKLDSSDVVQIKKYAQAVTEDERFNFVKGVTWDFWLISNSYDRFVARDIRAGPNSSKHLVADDPEMNYRIGIRTWGELLEENRDRLQFFQKHLEHKADRSVAMQYLRERHAEFLHGVVDP